MNPLALNPVVSSPTVSTANLVAAIVRALINNTQATNQATNTEVSQTKASNAQSNGTQFSNTQTGAASPDAVKTDAAQTKLGSILNLLLNPKNGAALMDINLDQLANSSLLQNVLRQLPPELLSRPRVFQALVLQNTLLPAMPTPEYAPTLPTPSSLPLLIVPPPLAEALLSTAPQIAGAALTSFTAPAVYRITLEWQNRLLQVLSPQPFPSGSRLQLQTNTRGEVTLVSSSPPSAIARVPNPLLAVTTATPVATNPQPPTPLQTLQQSARELLPRQQPLHTLVPLLQKFLQPSTQAQLPPAVVKAVLQLLRTLPRAEQMQDATVLRKVVENSGSFFESRLAREQIAPGRVPDSLAALFGTDIKAQLNAVLAAIRSVAPNALTMARAQPAQNDAEELVYSHKPGVNHSAIPLTSEDNKNDPADSLLTQLGKLLQTGLARIQLNQLDSASARQVGNDNQPPLPTWIVEVPLRTQYGADQLQLRIEQRPARQHSKTKQQWTVHIALDLHAAGKLAATLTIAEKSVAATLWAEHENTHRAVRNELDFLRAGLESVGVKVTEMQCRLGVPPVRSSALTQRLVDVHT